MTSLLPPRLRRAALSLACVFGSAIACSGSESSNVQQTVTQPPPPPPPKPTIVISTDSVGATLIAGAPKTTQSVDITAGTTTALAALTVADVSVAAGQPTTWISATVSAQTAPAKLVVTIDPSLPPGNYSAVIHVGATDAETKSVRVSLVVKARPVLLIDTTALSFRGELGAPLGARTIHVTSVNGAIDSLSVSKPDCGAAPAWLSATLSNTTTPATLQLEATPGALKAASYTCSFVLSTSQTLVDSSSQTVRASLTLVAVPRLVVSLDTVRASAFRRADAQPYTVSITNGGTGTLDGLSVGQISYGTGASDWLAASLDQSSAPATLTLRSTARSLGPGLYTASVPIQSSMDGVLNNPTIVPVRFIVSPVVSSGIVLTPNPLRITYKAGTTPPTLSFSVLANGDTPLQSMGPGHLSGPFVYFSFGCSGPAYSTPCSTTIQPVASTAGTYTTTLEIVSYVSPPLIAVETIIVTVTP